MKQIIKFSIYKLLETAGVFLVYYGLTWYGLFLDRLFEFNDVEWESAASRWLEAPMIGFCVGVFTPAVILIIGYGVFCALTAWVKWNWRKAGE